MNKLDLLYSILQKKKSILIAYSGGVDSALLLAAAQQVLENNVIAATIQSELTSKAELDNAHKIANILGIKHLIIQGNELQNPDFCKNSSQRCYFCKKERFIHLQELANKLGIATVAEGSNIDDLEDFRPGSKAAKELGIASPLQEAGLTKKEIRELAKKFNLPCWNTPSQSCLATRIPYEITITKEALFRIRKAETFLKTFLGSAEPLRVRDHGEIARIEVAPFLFNKLLKPDLAEIIYTEMRNLGYSFTSLDILGYRQGSMNESEKEVRGRKSEVGKNHKIINPPSAHSDC